MLTDAKYRFNGVLAVYKNWHPLCFLFNQQNKKIGESESMKRNRRKGATSTEYLFILLLILIAVLASVVFFGQTTNKTMQENSSQLKSVLSQNEPSA